jgi:hypothetical protein
VADSFGADRIRIGESFKRSDADIEAFLDQINQSIVFCRQDRQ